MKVAIIGTGKMGRGFAQSLAAKHEVLVGSRDPSRARVIATKTGAAEGVSYADASVGADVVILTVPWHAMDETLAQLGDLDGVVVVDVSFPSNKAERETLKGSSTAEAIQHEYRALGFSRAGTTFTHDTFRTLRSTGSPRRY
jgi:8-hydroxy-5-deazaflavin:NADPH oxidoreductase